MSMIQKIANIPEELLDQVPKRFDIVGDIAVVSVPAELELYKLPVAEHIASTRGNIRGVLNKVTKLEGEHRVAGFEVLLGDVPVTIHEEFGFRSGMDLREVFFNGRLAFERQRVSSKVRADEDVIVPFCGIGPFAIPAAAKGAKVVAIEKNPHACRWLFENVRLNNVDGNIHPILADASDIGSFLKARFDRAIIPTPYGMDGFLEKLLPFVRKGGNVHFYAFKKQYQIEGLMGQYSDMGLDVVEHRRCGNIAPSISRWAFDMVKE
ncbi:class I SAM-dependent methyltransferase [Methanococcoides sp.]|uniref:class I SAM-dependent methyltransferase n=1 Tax=Methanococcoides sp. TaxID=1966350 RepID=UPI00272E8FA9|nr:class I SAM-dependent methyltransferase family protein [Methanococcoides sp.]